MNELQHLKQQLNELIETRAIKISSGNVPDFTVYKQIVGENTGLSLAVGLIDDLQKKINEANNVE